MGQPSSVDQVVLEGHDFGVALSAPYVLSLIQPTLDHLKATFVQHLHYYSVTSIGVGPFSVDVLTIDIHYTVTLDSASAEWSAGRPR